MALPVGFKTPLIDDLIRYPQAFNFFQAIRLLQEHAGEDPYPLGSSYHPLQESLRFKSFIACHQPTSSIEHIEITSQEKTTCTLYLNFRGIAGLYGVLPDWYNEMILKQGKEGAFADFLDIFNHRSMSFLYKAWSRNRFYIGYKRHLKTPSPDTFTLMLNSFQGYSYPQKDKAFEKIRLFYGGLLNAYQGNEENLRGLLNDFLQLPVTLHPFQETTLCLSSQDYSVLGIQFHSLGKTSVLGKSFKSLKHKCRLVVGPLTFRDFQKFHPFQPLFQKVKKIVSFYAKCTLDFDIQLLLKGTDVPPCGLKKKCRLGWDTWLKQETPRTYRDDVIRSINDQSSY